MIAIGSNITVTDGGYGEYGGSMSLPSKLKGQQGTVMEIDRSIMVGHDYQVKVRLPKYTLWLFASDLKPTTVSRPSP